MDALPGPRISSPRSWIGYCDETSSTSLVCEFCGRGHAGARVRTGGWVREPQAGQADPTLVVSLAVPGHHRGNQEGIQGRFPGGVTEFVRCYGDLPEKIVRRISTVAAELQRDIDPHGIEARLHQGGGAGIVAAQGE